VVRRPDRAARCGIRRGRSKKLRSAFRDRLTGAAGAAAWLAKLAEEYPEEGLILPETEDNPEPQPWHGLYWRAFEALRFDRQYGALGGETPISYIAISRYAEDHGIGPDDIHLFHTLIAAVDAEWLAYVAAEQERKAQK
jgi:hypothetical protein